MGIGSGLLALAILAAEGPSCPSDCATTFQVRVLTLDGLDWRTDSYNRLQPVARQGTSTVWTADRALVGVLSDRARSATNFGTIVSTNDATLTRCEAVNYVAAVERFADGPINQSSAIAFLPKPERLDERFAVKLSGRKLDQGILAQVVLEETHVDVMHDVPQTESLLQCASKTTRTAAEIGRDVVNVVLAGQPRESSQTITCSVQVPEISQAKVEGEWLIPNNGVLLVSLGVKTVADDQGKAVVRERVAVIDANPTPMPSTAKLGSVEAAHPLPRPSTRLAMPALPARSLPQPLLPNGDLVDAGLPPLPEGLASTDLDRIKPAPNQPSPQAPYIADPFRDSQLSRTSYDAAPPMEKEKTVAEVYCEASRVGARINKEILGKVIDLLEQAGVMSIETQGVVKGQTRAESVVADMEEMLDLLAKLGVQVDFNIDARSPIFNPTKPVCDKCDDDDPFCPAKAQPTSNESVAGGLKVVPEPPCELGVSSQDARKEAPGAWKPRSKASQPGVSSNEGKVGGTFKVDLKEALKTPGKTETTMVPLGGRFSLEIKTTLVPSPSQEANTASKPDEAPAMKR